MSTQKDVYDALVTAGLNSSQAIGVMGNIQNESSFNVEAHALDSNGKYSNGLIQWNEGSYPTSGTLVTGNVAGDLQHQANFLIHNTHNIGQGISGTTPEQVAGNFAQFVEVCQGCQPGGAQYQQRVANAKSIAKSAASGNWPQTAQTTGIFNPLAGIGGGIAGSIVNGVFSGILSAFGVPSFKDMFERLGLILLGVALVLLGLHMMGQNITAPNSKDEKGDGEKDEGEKGEGEPKAPGIKSGAAAKGLEREAGAAVIAA